jgi:hypothetical protein
LLAAIHGLAQLLRPWTSNPFGVVLALLPDLILVVGAEGMVGIGSGAILGPKGTMLHLVDPGHFLEDHLALLDKFTHGGNYCLVTRHIPAKNEGKFQDVTILSCTLEERSPPKTRRGHGSFI